jgi:hypothetical protein
MYRYTRIKIWSLILVCTCFFANVNAQNNAECLKDTLVKTAMLFPTGNQLGFPLIKPNTTDQLELHFDDLNGGYKNYYYTFQLCNADWSNAMVTYFDYIKGFTNNRINTFRVSSIAQKKYTHYSAVLPERNCVPTKSGNYLLKVYLDSDTSKIVFTKRFIVMDEKVIAAAQITQPLGSSVFNTHQRILVRVNSQGLALTNAHQQLKLVVLQNQQWENNSKNVLPTFVRGKDIEYNTETDFVFQAGREWRWADLRSFRFWSDRVAKGEMLKGENKVHLRPDANRSGLRYSFFRDLNGLFTIENTDNINPYWQSDYAKVHFYYTPPFNTAFANKNLYLIGKLTNYELNEQYKLKFNEVTKQYETALLLKQGFYSYQYTLVNDEDKNKTSSLATTEGNYWETENTYQVLIYYKPFGARYDELVGYTTVSSLNGRIGPGF